MLRLYCFFLLLFSGYSLTAQSATWLQQIHTGQEGGRVLDKIGGIIETEEGGFVAVINIKNTVITTHEQRIVRFVKLSPVGEILWEKDFDFDIMESNAQNVAGPSASIITQIPVLEENYMIFGDFERDSMDAGKHISVVNLNSEQFCFKDATSENFRNSAIYTKGNQDFDEGLFLSNDNSIQFIGHCQQDFVQLIETNMTRYTNFLTNGANLTTMSIRGDALGLENYTFLFGPQTEMLLSEGVIQDTAYHFGDIMLYAERGNILVYGYDLFKLSGNFALLWRIPNAVLHQGIRSHEPIGSLYTNDGGYLFWGYGFNSVTSTETSFYLIKVDKNGNITFKNQYDFARFPLNKVRNVIEVGGGFVMIGGQDADQSLWVAKVNEDGLLTANNRVVKPKRNVVLYPNPTTHQLTIEFDDVTTAEVKLYATDGKLVLQDLFDNEKHKILNVSYLEKGVYWLSVDNQYFEKVVIH